MFLIAAAAGNPRADINYAGLRRCGMSDLRSDPGLSARWSRFLAARPEYSPVPGR
jgi:hypothetical protein